VLFLHPYEIVSPFSQWVPGTWWDVAKHPLLLPFTWNKSGFLATLLRNFPVSPVGTYLDEALKIRAQV
jgi:hypothetical protein